MTVNCQVLPSGDLLVTADNETRAEIARGMNDFGYWGTFADAFEPHSCNGSYTPFDAGDGDPFVGLTSAPCIAETLFYDDDGRRDIDGRLWWFPDYMVRDPLDELKSHGRTVFSLAS